MLALKKRGFLRVSITQYIIAATTRTLGQDSVENWYWLLRNTESEVQA